MASVVPSFIPLLITHRTTAVKTARHRLNLRYKAQMRALILEINQPAKEKARFSESPALRLAKTAGRIIGSYAIL